MYVVVAIRVPVLNETNLCQAKSDTMETIALKGHKVKTFKKSNSRGLYNS